MELIGTKIAGVAKIENDLQIYIWEIRWNEALMSIPKQWNPDLRNLQLENMIGETLEVLQT